MNDKAIKMLELRHLFTNVNTEAYGERWQALVFLRDWAKLCGHRQTVDGVDGFMRFINGEPDE